MRELLAELAVLDEPDAIDNDFVDRVETRAFEVQGGEGECSA